MAHPMPPRYACVNVWNDSHGTAPASPSTHRPSSRGLTLAVASPTGARRPSHGAFPPPGAPPVDRSARARWRPEDLDGGEARASAARVAPAASMTMARPASYQLDPQQSPPLPYPRQAACR